MEDRFCQGITIYYSDVEFERYNLRFLVAFDADGALNTIRLVPAPAVSTAQPVAYDKTKMDERILRWEPTATSFPER